MPGEPEAKVTAFPPPPPYFDEHGIAIWVELGKWLPRYDLMQNIDFISLETFCYNWQRYREAVRLNVDIPTGVQNGLHRGFAEFGLTPAARLQFRKRASEGPEAKKNRFEKLEQPSSSARAA